MLTDNLKIGLAAVALIAALVVLGADDAIAQGTGLIVATLAAGGGWLIRDTHDEARRRRSICQAYAAVIEAQFEAIQATLSDAELDRFEALAPAIASGAEPESIGSKTDDPFAGLPDIRDQMHLLSPDTTRLLWKWRLRAVDLFAIYDELGTKRISALGPARLGPYFEWIKRYRDEYRDIGYAALKRLAEDSPGLKVDVTTHEQAGARDGAGATLL
jgi:hypothetical protein